MPAPHPDNGGRDVERAEMGVHDGRIAVAGPDHACQLARLLECSAGPDEPDLGQIVEFLQPRATARYG